MWQNVKQRAGASHTITKSGPAGGCRYIRMLPSLVKRPNWPPRVFATISCFLPKMSFGAFSFLPELCNVFAILEVFGVLIGHSTAPPTPKCRRVVSPAEKYATAKDEVRIQDSPTGQQRFALACSEYYHIDRGSGHKLIVPVEFRPESRAYQDVLLLAQAQEGWCCIQGQIKRMTKAQCGNDKGQYFSSREEAVKSCGRFFRPEFPRMR